MLAAAEQEDMMLSGSLFGLERVSISLLGRWLSGRNHSANMLGIADDVRWWHLLRNDGLTRKHLSIALRRLRRSRAGFQFQPVRNIAE